MHCKRVHCESVLQDFFTNLLMITLYCKCICVLSIAYVKYCNVTQALAYSWRFVLKQILNCYHCVFTDICIF